jgi:hypothetical protein
MAGSGAAAAWPAARAGGAGGAAGGAGRCARAARASPKKPRERGRADAHQGRGGDGRLEHADERVAVDRLHHVVLRRRPARAACASGGRRGWRLANLKASVVSRRAGPPRRGCASPHLRLRGRADHERRRARAGAAAGKARRLRRGLRRGQSLILAQTAAPGRRCRRQRAAHAPRRRHAQASHALAEHAGARGRLAGALRGTHAKASGRVSARLRPRAPRPPPPASPPAAPGTRRPAPAPQSWTERWPPFCL